MNRKITHALLVLAIVLASTFLPVAASSAESREAPRPAMRAGTDWLGSALTWLNDVLGERIERARERKPSSSVVAKAEDGGDENSATGICIDPMGRPRPCPQS